ncbi:MAG: response regulator [Coriobacteriia bacterium]|nr:response regulator [Coriobacteriia bacterium]
MIKKVLVVDDEPSIRKLLSVALGNRGFEVLEAEDGVAALGAITAEKPDLVVLDVMMPGMTGHEVHDQLRSRPETKELPVLFLSAAGTFEEQHRNIASDPFADYLPKPFKPSEVADHIDAMLDPTKQVEVQRERGRREAKLSKIVEIMHRDRG